MAVNPRRVAERVVERIRSSDYTLRIVFPRAKPKPTGTTAIPLPSSPLVAVPNPQSASEEEIERIQSDIVVKCLYLEAGALSDLRSQQIQAQMTGWTRDFRGYARVIASDVDRPGGGTVLEGCDYVEVAGGRYKVLSVVRASASMMDSGTYYVVLTGAAKT